MGLLNDDQRASVRRYVGGALGFLRLVPDLPGQTDDRALGAVRTILASAAAALQRRSPEEVIATLRALAETEAATLDLDAIAEHVKTQLARLQDGEG